MFLRLPGWVPAEVRQFCATYGMVGEAKMGDFPFAAREELRALCG